ncbi:putative bicyclomycin resistance protein [Aulographum hederae CBS 113979]|uniref:Putative bicyclomycin resistance protein n=1 Tax=Aulographum hederae CBS 113979 TaxID=1176131 RepID=A0A6G1GRD9_9PEZI|nr:putative bicyclomycin resistance protein [Aulographum hederae CBS 113979]
MDHPEPREEEEEQDLGERDIEKASQHSTQGPATRVVTAQDWSGPDDPENPHNWSNLKKGYHVVIPGLFGFVVTFASSVFTPAVPQIVERFHVSRTAAILGLSLYVLGLAFGPVLAAPISETKGRRIVYIVSLPVSMLFTLGAGFSQSFGSLLVCRLLAGATGGPCLAVGAGTNADLFPPQKRAIATSLFLMAPFLGPSLGPFIGGFAAQYESWRWTQWCILFAGLPVFIFSAGMQETYKKIILQNRAKKLNIPPPPKVGPTGLAAIKFLITVTLLRPLHMLFSEPIVAFLSLYTGFTFAVLFTFFAAFPIVFSGVYGFTPSQTGLTFLAVGLGVCIASTTAIIWDRTLYQKQHRKVIAAGGAFVAPEYRLYAAMFGSFGVPIGLFWFAWTARSDIHFMVPIVAMIPFAWGNLSIFISSALYLVDTYGALNGASAMAANGVARYAAGAAFPLFTLQMYSTLGIGWATSLLGFLSVVMLPIPWVLFRWGPTIRAKSAYDTLKA